MILSIQTLNFSSTSTQNVKDYFEKERDMLIKENLLTQSFLSGLVPDKLELKNISFSYDEKKILENINLSIPRGSIISIEGESGSGKSTLLDLITGLQKPSAGQILFNEEVVDEEYSLTDITGYVIQDTYIFNKSLRENIALGIDPIDIDEKVLKILEDLNLMSLTSSKDGLNIMLAGGSFISGGQRQRIGIARALYKDSKILFLMKQQVL